MTAQTRKLRAWMTLRGVMPKAVAGANGISLRAVHRFIAGTMTSDPLRTWFLDHGCPASHLPANKKPANKKTTTLGKAA